MFNRVNVTLLMRNTNFWYKHATGNLQAVTCNPKLVTCNPLKPFFIFHIDKHSGSDQQHEYP
jgi:hypothetical protein